MSALAWPEFIARVNNDTLWELLDRRSLSVQPVGENAYIPIPPFSLSSPYPVLAVGSRNPDAPPSWYLGCWMQARIAAGISVQAEIAQLLELGNYSIPLNQFKLISLPEFLERPYGLRFVIPRWHKQLQIEIWWFNDPFTTSVEASLDRIEQALLSLE